MLAFCVFLQSCASDDDDNVTIDAFHVCSETNDINKKIKLLRIFRMTAGGLKRWNSIDA